MELQNEKLIFPGKTGKNSAPLAQRMPAEDDGCRSPTLLPSPGTLIPMSLEGRPTTRSLQENEGLPITSSSTTREEQPLALRLVALTPTGCKKEVAGSSQRTNETIETIGIASMVDTDMSDGKTSMRGRESSDGSVITNASTKRKRGRGRPPIDEEANRKRKARIEEEAQEAKERRIRDLTDPSIEAPRSLNRKKLESWAKEEVLYLPSRAIPATILEEIRVIDKVTQTSRSLSGPYQGCLNRAAARLTAVAARFSYEKREESCPVGATALLEEMRESLASLRVENDILKRRIEELERRDPVNQGQKAGRNKAGNGGKERSRSKGSGNKGRRRIDSSSSPSSSEEEMDVGPGVRAE